MVSRRFLLTLVLVLMTCWVLVISNKPASAQVGTEAQPQLVLQTRALDVSPRSLAFAPDGRSLAIGSYTDGIVCRPDTGQIIARLHPGVRIIVGSVQEPPSVVPGPNGLIPLPGGAGLPTLLPAIDDKVAPLVYDPTGAFLASGGVGNWISLWDANTGALVGRMRGHYGKVTALAFSRDGRRLVSGGEEGFVLVWDLTTGQEPRVLKGHRGQVASVALSQDGTRIASGGWDHTVRLWDADAGACLHVLPHTQIVESVAFSPDGGLLASGDVSVRLWDARTGDLLGEIGPPDGGGVGSLAFSPDGALLAASGYKGMRLWKASSRELVRTFQEADDCTCVAFSPDGARLVSGSGYVGRSAILVWDLATGACLRNFGDHTASARALSVDGDGRRLAQNGGQGNVLDLATGRPVWVGDPDADPWIGSAITLSADGERLFSLQGLGARLTDLGTGHVIREFAVEKEFADSMALSRDERLLATGNRGKTITVWDVSSGECLATLKGHGKPVAHVALSPDGRRLFSAAADHTLRFWDTATGKCIAPLKRGNYSVRELVWGNAATLLASTERDDKTELWRLCLWDGNTNTCLHTLEAQVLDLQELGGLAFSPDGRSLAVGGVGRVLLLDVASGQLQRAIEGHPGLVSALAFTPDGSRLLCATEADTIRLWELASDRCLAQFVPMSGKGLDSSDWLTITPEGYYDGSPDALKLISWRVGEEVFPEETYHDKFYRPDLVQKALAGESLAPPAGG